jgi:hypothetical protein
MNLPELALGQTSWQYSRIDEGWWLGWLLHVKYIRQIKRRQEIAAELIFFLISN